MCLLRFWDEEGAVPRAGPRDRYFPHLYSCPTPDTGFASFHLPCPILSSMFLLSYLTYIPWKWLFLPFHHTVNIPQALGKRKLLELPFGGGSGEKRVPGTRLGCSPYPCGVCPSRSLGTLGTYPQTERIRGFGSWEGCPGESTRKGPRGRQKAELGLQQEGVGHQGSEQMEGNCIAELHSSASKVWKNLMGMVSSYFGHLIPFPLTYHLP